MTRPADPDPISAAAPDLPGRAVIRQVWSDLAFVHWRVDPALVAPLLPPGTRPDVHDGSSWVGLIPFVLSRSAFPPLPAVPWAGTFAELNVRLYSVGDDGRRGVVFRSLEAAKLLPVIGARAGLGLPYMWASMTHEEHDGVVTYTSRRHTGSRPASSLSVRPLGEEVEGDPLADFLTARWGMHVARGGVTRYWPNTHDAWTLERAELVDLDDELVAAAGLPGIVDRAPDSVLFSRGVRTEFAGPLRPRA
ncbi:YqjF family protein [Clavibacter nebraskensis]|uniref:YqjF family protein n=1 Tax=Clavibacter nebraskensis TaxID=31963 RepID=UPI003F86B927